MKKNEVIPSQYDSTSRITTISDLRDDYFDGIDLLGDQKAALAIFDKYKINTLSTASSEDDFQKKYFNLQIEENTKDYKLFLV